MCVYGSMDRHVQYLFVDFQWKNKLRFVRIYFDTGFSIIGGNHIFCCNDYIGKDICEIFIDTKYYKR